MARKPRIHYPGAVYHVILRGNAGQSIFFSDNDRYRLYLILQHTVEKFGCRVHGFCLMSNHVHLIMQTGEIPLSRIMQNFSLRYTKWINYTQRRTGHVFQGRYKALLLDADTYLQELVRYVYLNPVRSGLVTVPEDYPWSGHRAYLGIESIPWLTTDWVLSIFSGKNNFARNKYRSYVAEGLTEGKRDEFHKGTSEGRILGDDIFADDVFGRANQRRRRVCSINDVTETVCRRYGISEEQLKAPGKARPYTEARALTALLVQESSYLSLTELGKVLKRDISPLGRAGRRLLEQAHQNARLAELIEDMRSKFIE